MNIIVYRNCFTGDVSGGDMHMAGVLHWLSKHKRDSISLVHAKNDEQGEAYEDVRRLNNITYWCPNPRWPALLYVLRALLGWWLPRLPYKAKTKNILIASSHFLPDVLPVALKLRARSCERVVYIYHIVQDMPRTGGLTTHLANLQERLCFYLIKKRFDKVVVVNKAVKARLAELGFRRQAISISSNFASQEPLPMRELAHKDITLLFCGRLVKQKGVYDFIEVCRFLQEEIPGFFAVMAGAGPEEQRLRNIVNKEELPIEIKGRVSEKEKFELFSRAQLFVFPSIEEGWGIVVAEALSAGTPVLAYDLAVYQEIFSCNLHTVGQGDVAAMKQNALCLLQRYSLQPALYHAEQQRITEFADRFRKANVVEGEYTFFNS